jgi:hypothetical protein
VGYASEMVRKSPSGLGICITFVIVHRSELRCQLYQLVLFNRFHLCTTSIVLFCEKDIGITFFTFIAPFLGAFAKLRKATNSFVMSVLPPFRMEQLGSHWTGFYEI